MEDFKFPVFSSDLPPPAAPLSWGAPTGPVPGPPVDVCVPTVSATHSQSGGAHQALWRSRLPHCQASRDLHRGIQRQESRGNPLSVRAMGTGWVFIHNCLLNDDVGFMTLCWVVIIAGLMSGFHWGGGVIGLVYRGFGCLNQGCRVKRRRKGHFWHLDMMAVTYFGLLLGTGVFEVSDPSCSSLTHPYTYSQIITQGIKLGNFPNPGSSKFWPLFFTLLYSII